MNQKIYKPNQCIQAELMNKILHYCDCYPEYIGKWSHYHDCIFAILFLWSYFQKGLAILWTQQTDWRVSFTLMEFVFRSSWSVLNEMKQSAFQLVIAINFIWKIFM